MSSVSGPPSPSEEELYFLESYIQRFQLNPKTSTEPLLQPYEIQEAFQRYLLDKMERIFDKEGDVLDPVLNSVWKEIDSCSSVIPMDRLNRLSYLVHTTSSERQLLSSMPRLSDLSQCSSLRPKLFAIGFYQIADSAVQWPIASKLDDPDFQDHYQETLSIHPFDEVKKEVEKMEQDLAQIPNSSLLKQYLVAARALDKQGRFPKEESSIETKQNIQYALQRLARILKIEAYDLKDWNEKTHEALYARFLDVLAAGKYDPTVKTQFERINKPKKSCEQKAQEILRLLDEKTGGSGIQKLKDAFSIKVEETDLLDFPGVGLTWHPQRPLLEQRDVSFNSLCLSTFLEISHKRGIEIHPSALYLAREGSDFSGLESATSQMPKLGERVRDKVVNLCKELGMQTSSDTSTYDLYCLFKEVFKKRYIALKEKVQINELQSLLLEEAYLKKNVPLLLKIESDLPRLEIEVVTSSASSSPTNTTGEISSVFSMDLSSPEKPDPHLVQDFAAFKDWIDQNKSSVFSHFVSEKRLFDCEGDESQLLNMARFIVEVYIDRLRFEASMMKEPFPDKVHNLEELEVLSSELAYKKFLKGLDIAQRKHSESKVLTELVEVNQRTISTREKRASSIKMLDKSHSEPYLQKLLQYLVFLFNREISQTVAAIPLDAFSSYKTKTQAFKWLLESSFFKSLEVDIGTKNSPQIEKALLVFREKMGRQMERLNMPPIYSDLLDYFIKNGEVKGLKNLSYEVAYQRYTQSIATIENKEVEEELKLLSEFNAELKATDTFQRIDLTKKNLRKSVKDPVLLNYLLFQLEQLPFNSRELSEEDKDLIYDYLQEINDPRPFDAYLKENCFSWFGYNEEPCDWIAYLYEQFTTKLIKDAKVSKYSTTQLLALELDHLDLFDFKKLDYIATLVQSHKAVTVQDLYKFGFMYSVKKLLKGPQYKGNHQKNFEAIEDISIQVAFLDHLSKDLELSHLVYATMTEGSSRSLNVGYEFLKDVMKQPFMMKNKEAFRSFFFVHFLRYSDDLVQLISKESEDEIKKVKELEEFIQEEAVAPALRAILEKDKVIDEKGHCTGLFSLMPLNELEPYIRLIKTFLESNYLFGSPSPYLGTWAISEDNSWKELLIYINNLLKGAKNPNDFIPCTSKQVAGLIETVLNSSNGSFSTSLRNMGFCQMAGMSPNKYYQGYLRCEVYAFKYFEEKLANLERQKNDLLTGLKVTAFKKIVNTVVSNDRSRDVLKDLKSGIEQRDWSSVNESTDLIIHMEYWIAFIESALSLFQKNEFGALKFVLDQVKNETKGSFREKNESALENLSQRFSNTEREKLRSILMNQNWMEKLESSIRLKWNWARPKAYLKSFADIHIDPTTLSPFQKLVISDNVFSSLAESLLKEVVALEMEEGYKELIKIAHYEDCLFLWDWIVEEVSYQKCLFKIQEARNKGKDMSMFDDLDEETKNCTIYEKQSLVLKRLEGSTSTACIEILSSIESEDFFVMELYSLTE